jgi:hypothetical protein
MPGVEVHSRIQNIDKMLVHVLRTGRHLPTDAIIDRSLHRTPTEARYRCLRLLQPTSGCVRNTGSLVAEMCSTGSLE